ncbi:phage baseplate assembly protein V [Pantoea sp. Bo_2]|uniref:phage baseplate assembly protein V n=1 Tax=unclassified Pantoea TaxID=2630326 RepID=UPI001231ECFC|nr:MULTISPECIES: phage baseplate assembly protein V [unclassified Pantoea]KAA5944004.1 phage baseplate assembly protein V [Pantoea sp. VH_3]KAA5951581.1 phage baseplate assembly protein V [Pantoea sp. VH_25]KAA5981565.1 phage baseplate assembly protein V [Pantoea sp. M_3]KAA6044581.1 phage baseplate assembly protein V [Pantoea sp. FN_2b]KAA6049006.1 phage baseplate assembly protein V [Pantoea sp. Bo_5]
MNEQLAEIQRLLRNLIRIGTVSAVNLDGGLCRVDTGKNTTGWLHWLSARAGKTRSWNAPSVGEQVLILCLGGELDTGFVLPGIFSDDNPAPSASADALHWSFPDGSVIEYEPKTGALTATGIQTATIKAAVKILFDSPEVECTTLLKTAQLEVTKGGTMKGDVTHTGGNLSSNGKVLHKHKHPGDSGGQTGEPI